MNSTTAKKVKWSVDNVNKLLELKGKYNKLYVSHRGFSQEGWKAISDDVKINAAACRKKYNELLKKYREVKSMKDPERQKSWIYFEKFRAHSLIPKQLLDHGYQGKPRGPAYYRWEDTKQVLKLIKLRRDYGPEYKTLQGFALEGWRKIADTLGSENEATSCRKKYLKLVKRFKELTNRRETETPDFFASMLTMVSNPQAVLKKKFKPDKGSERGYYKWGDKVFALINIRKELDAEFSTSYGFPPIGWEEIARRIDPEKLTGPICRMKFLKLTTKHESYILHQDNLKDFSQFCDSLVRMLQEENSKIFNQKPTVEVISTPESEQAIADALSNKKKKFETARQYFKWENSAHTFKLIELVEKYSNDYQSTSGNYLASIIWKKISEDFDNQVTPGSCRKKYSILLKKYKSIRDEKKPGAKNQWIFFNAIDSFNNDNPKKEELFNDDSSKDSFLEEVEVEPIAVCEEEVPLNVAVVPTCVFCISISPNINTPTLINIAENEGRQDIVDKINFVLFENVTEKFNENIHKLICSSCFVNIEMSFQFKKQCRSSLEQLKSVQEVSTAEIVKHEHNYENKGKKGDSDQTVQPRKTFMLRRKMKKCCTICQRFFINLNRHKLIAHSGRPKLKECHYCSKSFTIDQLKSHIKSHEDEKAYQCSICTRRFAEIKHLQHHVDEMHTADSKKYGCGICGAKFVLAISLKKHFLIHGNRNGVTDVVHKCQVCSKVFVSRNGLRMHSLIHELPFACPLCPECFASEPLLELHCVAQHNEPTPFSCFYCNMKFNYQSSMDLHYEEQHEKDIMDYLQEDAVVGIFK